MARVVGFRNLFPKLVQNTKNLLLHVQKLQKNSYVFFSLPINCVLRMSSYLIYLISQYYDIK